MVDLIYKIMFRGVTMGFKFIYLFIFIFIIHLAKNCRVSKRQKESTAIPQTSIKFLSLK